MKRILISALLASFSILASAAVVTEQLAEAYAQKVFSATRRMEVIASNKVIAATSVKDKPSFYIINNPSGGWVIVSGDDCTYPLLAYSDKGRISPDVLPSNMEVWLSCIDRNINSLRRHGVKAGPDVRSKWAGPALRTKSGEGGRLLETAEWSQGAPFFNLCPMDGKNRSVTGCVATAMAIVLHYNKWPEHGKGTLDSYKTISSGIDISGFSLEDHYYNWDDMPMTYGPESSTAQIKAVAQLMYDCGVMVEMDYSSSASSANSEDIIPALARHMFYSSNARELYHCNYSDKEWLSMIMAEIDAGRPLLYGGSDEEINKGHQFVCDGYDDNGFIHINWGWNGQCNGYFAVSYIGDRDDIGGVLNDYDSAIFGLVPDPDAPSVFSTELYLYADGITFNGIELKSGEIKKDCDFCISVGDICNDSFETDYNGAFKAALVDRNGSVKEFIGKEEDLHVDKATIVSSTEFSPGRTDIPGYDCHISADVSMGDAVVIYYSLPDGNWTKMGGGRHDTCAISALGAYDACFLNIPVDCRPGQAYYPDIIAGRKPIRTITLYYDGTICDRGYALLSSGVHELKAVLILGDGSSETIVQKIKVN